MPDHQSHDPSRADATPSDSLDDLSQAILSQHPTSSRREMDAEERKLWQQVASGDATARNVLVEKFFPLVEVNAENVVKSILQAVEESDFHQAGVVGYLEAVDAYRTDMGMSFEEFASLRIRDAIWDELQNFVRE